MRIFASIVAVLFAFNLNAQSNLKDLTRPTSIEEFTSFFNLNDDQVKKLESFTDRKSNQLAKAILYYTTLNLCFTYT